MWETDAILHFAIWRNPERVPQDGIERITRFCGDDMWKQAAYAESAQGNLFSRPDLIKKGNDVIAAAFQQRLKSVARFTFVPIRLR